MKDKKHRKVRDHSHYKGNVAAHSICNLRYSVCKIIPITFHNGSSYDYHFIINVLRTKDKKQFTCLGKNTEKYITFTITIGKEVTKIDKNGEKIAKNISYVLQFFDSVGFMAAHYQILSIIFLKKFVELNVNKEMMIKNVKFVELNISIGTAFLNT